MTRAYQTSRARRVTQPIAIVRPRDPTIQSLGFSCFRLFRDRQSYIAVAFVNRTNAMSAFMHLAR
jgi:hypothetical protein